MKNTNMSVGAFVLWGKLGSGIIWVLAGITGMFMGKFIETLHITILCSALIVVGILIKGKCREFDEMFEYNFMKANAATNRAMHYVLGVSAILCAIIYGLLHKHDFDINYVRTIPMLFMLMMGIQDIITAIIFKKLEAE